MKIKVLFIVVMMFIAGCSTASQGGFEPQSKNYRLGFELGVDLREKASRAYTPKQACLEARSGFLTSRFGGLMQINSTYREVVRTRDGQKGCIQGAKGL